MGGLFTTNPSSNILGISFPLALLGAQPRRQALIPIEVPKTH